MVRIRLKRLGRKHRPFFRISVIDQRAPRNGKSIEDIGHYDPMVADKSQRVRLDQDRLEYWLGVGAQPSEKVAALIRKVKTNKFGTAKAPPPATPPKAPEPEPTPEPETAAEADAAETAAESESAETETAESAATE